MSAASEEQGPEAPGHILIDARNVGRHAQCTQAVARGALQQERLEGSAEQLRQSAQLLKCYFKLRDFFPFTPIDVFVYEPYYLSNYDDTNFARIRDADRNAFQKAPGGRDVDEMLLASANDCRAKGVHVIVLSNDLFRDHVRRGVVDKAWVSKHVWSFMFCRRDGEVLIPGLDPFRDWTLEGRVSSAPRLGEDEKRPIVENGTVLIDLVSDDEGCQPDEVVPVRQLASSSLRLMHSRRGCLATSLRVAPGKGSGFVLAEEVRADPNEELLLLQERLMGLEGAWALVRTATGEGWLRREYLTPLVQDILFQEQGQSGTSSRTRPYPTDIPECLGPGQPAAKRVRLVPRLGGFWESRRFHVRDLGHGPDGTAYEEELRRQLEEHGLHVSSFSLKERPPPPDVEAPLPEDSLLAPPPLARWFVKELHLEGPQATLDSLALGSITVEVDGLQIKFTKPLPKFFKRGARPAPKPYVPRSDVPILPTLARNTLDNKAVSQVSPSACGPRVSGSQMSTCAPASQCSVRSQSLLSSAYPGGTQASQRSRFSQMSQCG